MSQRFALILFSTDPKFIGEAAAAGVDGIIVDWENREKPARQKGRDTEINYDTPDDLAKARAATEIPVICRINPPGDRTAEEVETAIEKGADEILLPMVRTRGEVETVLKRADGRCAVGILIETRDAVRAAQELAHLPLSRVYVGLNDLAIDKGRSNIFESVADGTVERVRRYFELPFGFGGATLPDRGRPIPCRLLLSEMARLQCSFTFLRRSFHTDIRGRDLAIEVPRIHRAIAEAFERTPEKVAEDLGNLHAVIRSQCLA